MQHPDILKLVETRAHEKDRNWLMRAKAQLQSDCWSADTRLDDRPDDEALQAERAQLRAAIDKIDGLLGVIFVVVIAGMSDYIRSVVGR